MARWISHKCNNCDFSFTGSGKLDALMRGEQSQWCVKPANQFMTELLSPGQMNLCLGVKLAAPKITLNGTMKRRCVLNALMVL